MGKKNKSKAQQGPPDTYIEADPEEAAQDAAKAGAVLPESALGKKMASADKKTRDKAVLVMSKWMAQQHSLDEDDHLKIWKALYYCYWMSDKPLVQQELASKLAELIHVFPSMQQSMLYFRTFFMTMLREWQGIDRLRLDKFYNLVRCFQREAFALLGRTGWKPSDVTAYNNIMAGAGGVLRMDCQVVGLQLHVCDIVLDELSDSMKSGLTPQGFMHIMSPYLSLMRETPDKAVFARLYRVLESLAGEQWLTAGLKEGAGDEDEEEDPLTTQPLRHNNRMFKHTYVPPIPKQSVNDMCKDKAFAGSVMHALTRRIFRVTISPSTFEMNRRKLYELLEVCKESCSALDQPFTEDPDDVSDEEEEGSKKAMGGHSKAASSVGGKKRAQGSDDSHDTKAAGSAKKGAKKRPAQAQEDEDDGDDDEEQSVPMSKKKKRKSQEGGGGGKEEQGGKAGVDKSAKKQQKAGSDVKSSKKKQLLEEASEEAAVKSRPGKLSVEERKKLRMSIESLSNTQGLLSPDITLSPVRHAASAADFFTGKIKAAEEGGKIKKGGPAKKKATPGKGKKAGK
mmetsp:Transcript_3263/g.8197  ORF Transcript_3263/g.8197 Transcript_3263/m.8197 type:complete len:566 (+) Transcript_3263:182-1879(+)